MYISQSKTKAGIFCSSLPGLLLSSVFPVAILSFLPSPFSRRDIVQGTITLHRVLSETKYVCTVPLLYQIVKSSRPLDHQFRAMILELVSKRCRELLIFRRAACLFVRLWHIILRISSRKVLSVRSTISKKGERSIKPLSFSLAHRFEI
ncbi:hypothetical protein EI42_00690 [Thermosporothrix hazakensis]|uniref:Uncharacterized protein n=1 Tax=Thermosporothrix hazakensis TaxID=644383 RepID=A0A326UEP8_THEHA|nr:hypothetical protein EI42_00690 [Thermosporothrix hazakensis]